MDWCLSEVGLLCGVFSACGCCWELEVEMNRIEETHLGCSSVMQGVEWGEF